jgi:hypothetical protein
VSKFSLRHPPSYHHDWWGRAGDHVPHFDLTVLVWAGVSETQSWHEERALAKQLGARAGIQMRNARHYSPGRPTRLEDTAGFAIYLGLA